MIFGSFVVLNPLELKEWLAVSTSSEITKQGPIVSSLKKHCGSTLKVIHLSSKYSGLFNKRAARLFNRPEYSRILNISDVLNKSVFTK